MGVELKNFCKRILNFRIQTEEGLSSYILYTKKSPIKCNHPMKMKFDWFYLFNLPSNLLLSIIRPDISEVAYRHQLLFFFFNFVLSVGVNKVGTEWMLAEKKCALSIGLFTDSLGPSDHKKQTAQLSYGIIFYRWNGWCTACESRTGFSGGQLLKELLS